MPKILCGFLAAFLLLGSLSACGGRSPATLYYVLDSEQQGLPQHLERIDKKNAVQLRRVDVPDYLDRNAIVTRESNNVRLKVSEFHSWAESLSSGTQRVLAEVLAPRLAAHKVSLQPLNDESAGPLQLFVQILRFDGTLDADTVLECRWTLRTQTDDIVAQNSFMGRLPSGNSYESLVSTQSKLLIALGENMASQIKDATLAYARRK